MFSIDTTNRQYIRIHATGRLSSSDYDAMEPALEAELARRALGQAQDERGRARLLLDLTGWRGWTAGGLLRDIRFDIRHRKSFPRIAVLGDRAWHKWLTYAAKPVFRGEMRYFDAAREREAVEWVAG
jgi:hypothetical protein